MDWMASRLVSLERDQDTLYAKLYEPATVARELQAAYETNINDQKLWAEQFKARLKENRSEAWEIMTLLGVWNFVLTVALAATWFVPLCVRWWG